MICLNYQQVSRFEVNTFASGSCFEENDVGKHWKAGRLLTVTLKSREFKSVDSSWNQFRWVWVFKTFSPVQHWGKNGDNEGHKNVRELCDIWTKIKETELTTNTMKKTKSQLKTLRIIICESTPISHIRYSDILNYRNELLHGETLYLDNPRSNKKEEPCAQLITISPCSVRCYVLRISRDLYQPNHLKE